jgi:hypothetical protein
LGTADFARRHLRFGWWALLVFAALGLALESLQGFKVAAYLDVSNDTRRLMWRLAHAHGGLLAAINILFALTLRTASAAPFPRVQRISTGLIAATILLPGGFFLGGVAFYSGDPGIGVLLVPIGAVLLLVALFWIARGVRA